jgi:hypothetical protein
MPAPRLHAQPGEFNAEPVETALPVRALRGKPGLRLTKSLGLQPAGTHPAYLLGGYRSSRFEHAQVLDHCRQRHDQRLGQFTDGGRADYQTLDHGTPAGVAQGMEHPVEFFRTVKHTLKYTRMSSKGQVTA